VRADGEDDADKNGEGVPHRRRRGGCLSRQERWPSRWWRAQRRLSYRWWQRVAEWGGVASVDSEDFAHFGSESEVGREFDIEDGTRITNLIPREAKQAEFCHFNSAQFRRAKQALCY
jgi:hypothetical protein